MPQATTGIAQTGGHIVALQIGELLYHLIGGEPYRQQIEHVADPNTHPPHTGVSPALVGIHSDPVHQLNGLTHLAALEVEDTRKIPRPSPT